MSKETTPEPVILNLGCGNDLRKGYINVDRRVPKGWNPSPTNQYTFQQVVIPHFDKWPWSDNSVDAILAKDFFEHLPDIINTLNECWRILKSGGRLAIIVPTTNGMGAWQDPTHRSFWNLNTLKYFEAGNPYHETHAENYGILGGWRVVRMRTWESPAGDGEKMEAVLQKS